MLKAEDAKHGGARAADRPDPLARGRHAHRDEVVLSTHVERVRVAARGVGDGFDDRTPRAGRRRARGRNERGRGEMKRRRIGIGLPPGRPLRSRVRARRLRHGLRREHPRRGVPRRRPEGHRGAREPEPPRRRPAAIRAPATAPGCCSRCPTRSSARRPTGSASSLPPAGAYAVGMIFLRPSRPSGAWQLAIVESVDRGRGPAAARLARRAGRSDADRRDRAPGDAAASARCSSSAAPAASRATPSSASST